MLGNDESLGTKLNSKVLIKDKHLVSIYYKHVKQYNYMWLNRNRRDKVCHR